jgi:hypothetical protein
MLIQLRSGIAKICRLLTEYRSKPRRCCDFALSISWRDDKGRIVHAKARCLDISDSGARIEYHQPIGKLSPIRICTVEGCVVRTGRVCYCSPVGSAYHVGIEFC